MYISDQIALVSRAVKELKGFQKILLAPGESKEVQFTVTLELMKFYNSKLEYVWEPGQFEVQIGGNSRDIKSAKFNWGQIKNIAMYKKILLNFQEDFLWI